MSIVEKIQQIAENQQLVYEAGQKSEYDRFWDEYQQNGTRTNYKFAFAGDAWVDKLHEMKYPIKFADASYTTRHCAHMFAYFHRDRTGLYDFTEMSKRIDFSGCKSAQALFNNACVDNITVDFSNVERLEQTFTAGDGGGGITSITITLTEKCTYFYNPFYYQSKLVNLIFTEGSVIAAAISFAQCSSLSNDSVQSIINALQDRTGLSALTVTFHTDVKSRMTEEQISQIATKNWNIG